MIKLFDAAKKADLLRRDSERATFYISGTLRVVTEYDGEVQFKDQDVRIENGDVEAIDIRGHTHNLEFTTVHYLDESDFT